MSDNIEKDFKNSKGDIAYTTAKAGLSMIPVLGGVAAEIFSTIITPPISRRRDEWLIKIANGLEELQSEFSEFDITALSQNETFITTVMHATHAAIKNHHEEKLEALKNAVLNSAISINIDDNVQLFFINYIDSLTPWHLKILDFMKNPAFWFESRNKKLPNIYMGAISSALEDAFHELKGNRTFYDLIIKDLFSQGLINTESIHTMMTGSGVFAPRTTELGNQFIQYITTPKV